MFVVPLLARLLPPSDTVTVPLCSSCAPSSPSATGVVARALRAELPGVVYTRRSDRILSSAPRMHCIRVYFLCVSGAWPRTRRVERFCSAARQKGTKESEAGDNVKAVTEVRDKEVQRGFGEDARVWGGGGIQHRVRRPPARQYHLISPSSPILCTVKPPLELSNKRVRRSCCLWYLFPTGRTFPSLAWISYFSAAPFTFLNLVFSYTPVTWAEPRSHSPSSASSVRAQMGYNILHVHRKVSVLELFALLSRTWQVQSSWTVNSW